MDQKWPVILAATGLALARMHFLERVRGVSEVAGNTSVLPGGSRGEPNFSRCPEVAQKWPVILAYYQGGDGDPNYDRGPKRRSWP